jgi:hypothetical protein
MALDLSELHAQRLAEAMAHIRRDFASAGAALPSDAALRRAADIVAAYPDAWPDYDAPPEDWDGRFAVALLWTWRKMKAQTPSPHAAAA